MIDRMRVVWVVCSVLLASFIDVTRAERGTLLDPVPRSTAQQMFTLTLHSFVPPSTQNEPLPDARAAAMRFTGIALVPGDVVEIDVTGTASGGPGFLFFDANGAPSGTQPFSGPVSDGEFANIIGPPADIYSVVGSIESDRSVTLSGVSDEWFLIGAHKTFGVTAVGLLVLMFHDAIYREDWVPAYTDNTGSFTVTVILPGVSEQLSNLRNAARGLGPGQSLVQKLESALAAVARGGDEAACNKIDAFINEVGAQTGKSIPASTASVLVAKACQINEALGCSCQVSPFGLRTGAVTPHAKIGGLTTDAGRDGPATVRISTWGRLKALYR